MTFCDTCDRYFSTWEALEQHERNSARHRVYECEECNRVFSSEWGLIQHYVQSPRHFYCQRCAKHFVNQDDLEEHYDDVHYWCRDCNKIFDHQVGLEEHRRQSHWYCQQCKRVFNNENNLNMHLRTSAVHNARQFTCPGTGCNRAFISYADLGLHLESGTCVSGITRQSLDSTIVRYDRRNVITNPSRLLTDSDGSRRGPAQTTIWATERSWNGYAYECVLCHKMFRTLPALNTHLQSPAHADSIYRCPPRFDGCNAEFRTISALLQHMERGTCGVSRFRRQITNTLDGVTRQMARIVM